MKMTIFWDVAPCSFIEFYRRFRGTYCLHRQGDHASVWEPMGCASNVRPAHRLVDSMTHVLFQLLVVLQMVNKLDFVIKSVIKS
jgi:hypothetical protein